MYLLLLDINSIQNYIFETNTLKEIIGASSLISYIQKKCVYDCLQNLDGNIERYDEVYKKLYFSDRKLGENANDYEVILSDGGNTIIIFSSITIAEQFQKNMFEYYNKYGIQITTPKPYSISSQDKSEKYFDFIRDIKKIKSDGYISNTLISAYPMKYCSSCAKRYVEFKDEIGENIDLLCRMCAQKRKFNELGEIEKLIEDKYGINIKFPSQMEHISNYLTRDIALISFDGNKVGNYIKNNIFDKQKSLIESLRKYGKFSISLQKEIVNTIVDTVYETFQPLEEQIQFRPLILAGDDITIAIDSYYALKFIENFYEKWSLNEFAKETEIKFSCGLVLAKANFPLHQLFQLSHELLSEAKSKNLKIQGKESVIDFYSIKSTLLGKLSYIRNKEYSFKEYGEDYICTRRPYFLGEFLNLINKAGKIKNIPNSKIKYLREIVRLGDTDKGRNELKRFKLHLGSSQMKLLNQLINKGSTVWISEDNKRKTDILDIIEISELI